jgi:peptidyl-prolyl cis-trans isomerase D
MLDGMRRNARSWGIKILFGIIILVFVFWGVGGFKGNKRGILAKINGEPILVQEFLKVYQSEYDRLVRQRPDLSSEDIKKLGLKRLVLEELINQTLLLQKARELGIVVPEEKLRNKITSMDVFKNKENVFDPKRYQMVLASNNLTPLEFETLVKKDMRIKKLREFITASVGVTEKEVKDLYDFVMKEAKIRYVEFNTTDYLNKVDVSDKEIAEYYKQNKDRFKEEEKIQIKYIKLSPDVLATEMQVSEEEIEKYYNENKTKFFVPEQRKIRHILIRIKKDDKEGKKAKQKILAILKKIKKGGDFAKLAQKYSEGPSAPKGGDIGWIKKGETVKEFEELAFSLKKGEIGGPVRTIFGYHLIKVEDIKGAHYKSLEEVKSEIHDILAREKASDRIEEFLDKALDEVFSSNSLDETGAKLNLPVLTSKLLTKSQMIDKLKIKPVDVEQLFLMENKKIYETPIIIDNGYIIAQKIKDVPARIKSLDEVRDKIVAILREQKAREMAKKDAKVVLSKLRKGVSLEAVKVKAVDSDFFELNGRFIPGLGTNGKLVRDMMLSKPGEWLKNVYEFDKKFVVVRVLETRLPSEDNWKKQKEFWKKMATQRKKQILFKEFLEGIKKKADIKIVNREFLEE